MNRRPAWSNRFQCRPPSWEASPNSIAPYPVWRSSFRWLPKTASPHPNDWFRYVCFAGRVTSSAPSVRFDRVLGRIRESVARSPAEKIKQIGAEAIPTGVVVGLFECFDGSEVASCGGTDRQARQARASPLPVALPYRTATVIRLPATPASIPNLAVTSCHPNMSAGPSILPSNHAPSTLEYGGGTLHARALPRPV